MTRFTTDNTEGYSASDLADLNAAFSVRMAELRCHGMDVDAENAKSLRDNQAERVLAAFDAAKLAEVDGNFYAADQYRNEARS